MSEDSKEQQVPQFDPNDQFQWGPDDKVTITGIEFYALLNFIKPFETAVMVKNSVMARMIRDGIAKRVVPEAQTEAPTEPPAKKPVMKVVPKDEPEEDFIKDAEVLEETKN